VLAADTQATSADGTKSIAHKLGKLPDGSIYGCAGDTSAILRIRRWLERGMPSRPRPRVPKETEWDVLLVKGDGSAWLLNNSFDFEKVEDAFCAIGSGSAYALAEMACGRSSVQAVKVAARFDVNTSTPIDILGVVLNQGAS
jgi:ATP-dependent protease HslVU (ClpYQ) peptidase subunit